MLKELDIIRFVKHKKMFKAVLEFLFSKAERSLIAKNKRLALHKSTKKVYYISSDSELELINVQNFEDNTRFKRLLD